MDVQVIVGLVALGVAIVAGIIAYKVPVQPTKSPTNTSSTRADALKIHNHVALMTFASWISVGSIVPQLIRNGELGENMDESTSPFFPALYPLIIFAKFPAERDLIKLTHSNNNTYGLATLVITQYFLLIGFIVWVFQFAAFSSSITIQIVFYTLGVLYSFGVLGISSWVYDVLKESETIQTEWTENEDIELVPLASELPKELSDLM